MTLPPYEVDSSAVVSSYYSSREVSSNRDEASSRQQVVLNIEHNLYSLLSVLVPTYTSTSSERSSQKTMTVVRGEELLPSKSHRE